MKNLKNNAYSIKIITNWLIDISYRYVKSTMAKSGDTSKTKKKVAKKETKSVGKKKTAKKAAPKSKIIKIVCSLCGGASIEPEKCRDFSTLYNNNHPETAQDKPIGCFATQCQSPVRYCYVCAYQRTIPVGRINAKSGLCKFHQANGPDARNEKAKKEGSSQTLDTDGLDDFAFMEQERKKKKTKKKAGKKSTKKKKPAEKAEIQEDYKPPYDSKTQLDLAVRRAWITTAQRQLHEKLGMETAHKPVEWFNRKSETALEKALKPIAVYLALYAAVRLVLAYEPVNKETLEAKIQELFPDIGDDKVLKPPYDPEIPLDSVLSTVYHVMAGSQLRQKLGQEVATKPIKWFRELPASKFDELMQPFRQAKKFTSAIRLVIADQEVTDENITAMRRSHELAEFRAMETAVLKAQEELLRERGIVRKEADAAIAEDLETKTYLLIFNRELRSIGIRIITPYIDQPRKRFNREKLIELAESIRTAGLQQPIRVKKSDDPKFEWQLVDGERRLRAHILLAKKYKHFATISAIIEHDITDDTQLFESSFIANFCREDLSPMEKALGLRRMQAEGGYTLNQMSKKSGMSIGTVRSLLMIATDLNPRVLAMMSHEMPDEEQLNMGIAVMLASKVPIKHQCELANEIVKKRLNYNKATWLARKFARQKGFTMDGPKTGVGDIGKKLHAMMQRHFDGLNSYIEVPDEDFNKMCRVYGHRKALLQAAKRLRRISSELHDRIEKAIPEAEEGKKIDKT